MNRGARVDIASLTRRYGQVTALDDLSLTVDQGEFLALLGPSGSGKSTLLMSLAGFETPDSGSISIDGQVIDRLPAYRRNIGMVFQRYALFPHLTVYENVAYPLRRRGVRQAEIARLTGEALALVKLEGYESRSIDQLSGGQQQRVALSRALVFKPPVLLMDEPMSALDKKLRQQMQMELKLLHRQIGTTVILVTHDQEEALSMADRIAVLNNGRIHQIDTPERLYRTPADAFVADFIGRTNFLPLADGSPARITGFDVPCGEALSEDSPPPAQGKFLGVRPENILLRAAAPGQPCRVVATAFAGASQSILLEAAGQRITAESRAEKGIWQPGDNAFLQFVPGSCRVFDTNH
ncbi:ABC transporter ATP-binding protein [Brenneria tiliae]|uniref:ABC transporter ATP-binding protein n=1 Tax=Brenneria tiliae TaxID=2914984 RepID=A0ABT0MR62_9GAMM|nr:ABC transporter ATP-binding protein [Brenneria tiliae]MCL2891664.1 ABC transporter ATP-binding protein [Brenneria tiliae]